MQVGAQSGDCCCASVTGMVSLVSTTAQTAITAIAALGGSVSGRLAGGKGDMARLAGLSNAGADAGYANAMQTDTDISFQNVSFIVSHFNDRIGSSLYCLQRLLKMIRPYWLTFLKLENMNRSSEYPLSVPNCFHRSSQV